MAGVDGRGASPAGGNSFLAKYNTSGNLIWAKGTQRTTSNAFTDISYDLAFDNAGNVFIGGTFFSSTMVFDNITLTNTQSPSTTMFMAKYDANGNVLWAKTPTSNNPNHYIWGISTDASGNVYFSGTFRATMTLDAVSISASSSGGKLFTVKCNSDGVAQWAKTATSNGYSAVDSSDVDSQGNLYVAGTFSDSTINFGNGITGSSPTTGAFFVVKYNTSGTPLWIRTASGLNINDRISIDCFSQNEIYVAGHFFGSNLTLGATTLTQAPTSGTDIFIAKLYYLPLGVDSFNADSVIFSPNPVDNMLYSNELDGYYNYVVRDFMGKKLTSGQVNSAMLQLSFGQYPSGIYFVEVQNEAGNTAVKKIIKK